MIELNEKQFISGFNSGYLLEANESALLNKLLLEIHPINSFMLGLKLGQMEYRLTRSTLDISKIRSKKSNEREK